MKEIVIFGTGKIADCVSYYFEREGDYRIVAYCCDRTFLKEKTFNGRPVVAFEEIVSLYPPERYAMFIALGYHEVNALRTQKYHEGLAKGYILASYVSPYVHGTFTIGANSLLLDNAVVQPKVTIGNNAFIWGGAMIGHHAIINDHCWVTGSANVGGLSTIGEGCFLGLNATIGHGVEVGSSSIIGANTLITKPVASESVIVSSDTEIHRLKVHQFLRLTSCFR